MIMNLKQNSSWRDYNYNCYKSIHVLSIRIYGFSYIHDVLVYGCIDNYVIASESLFE